MGRRARRRRIPARRRAALGRGSERSRRPLCLRVEHLRLRGLLRIAGGGRGGRGARARRGGLGERRDLRRAKGGRRTDRRRRVRRAGARRAAGAHRRAARPDGPLHVLASPRRPGRRGACAGRAGRPRAVHRRPRSRGLDRAGNGERRRWHVQRHGRADALRRPARRVPRGHRERRDVHVGGERAAPGSRGGTVDGAAALATASRLRRDAAGVDRTGPRRGAHVPAARGDGPRRRSTKRSPSTASASHPSASASCSLLRNRAWRELGGLCVPRVVAADAVGVDAAVLGEVGR